MQILIKIELFGQASKNPQISNDTKIRPVLHADRQTRDGRTDGQTDLTKLIAAFRNFANAPESDKGEMMQALSETFAVQITDF